MSGPAPVPKRVAIELRLRRVGQLFNSLDPSPFIEKDLDADAEEFVVTWAQEVPRDASLELVLHLDEEPGESQDAIGEAVRGYFAYRAAAKRHELRELLVTGRHSLIVGLLFMAACVVAAEALADVEQQPIPVLRESLLVGGWVAMWRPLQIFLYDWWPIARRRRLLDRLAEMPVRILLR